MPDISMCVNDEACPAKRNCYRSQASGTKPTERRQSYMAFHPEFGELCKGYWPVVYGEDDPPAPPKEPAP